jgi:hypothetical protein
LSHPDIWFILGEPGCKADKEEISKSRLMSEAKNNSKKCCFQRGLPILCLLIFLIFSEPAEAQYGIRLGSTFSTFYYTGDTPTPYDGYDVDLRPFLGFDVETAQTNAQKVLIAPSIHIYGRIKLSDRIFFQPELGYTQKGVNFSYTGYEKSTYKVKVNYLEVPASFCYQYLRREKLLVDFHAGGFAAFRLNAYKEVAFHPAAQERTTLRSVKALDWGFLTGTGLRYKVNDHFLVLDLRMFVGLQNIFTLPDDWTNIYYESHQTKITGINLSIGYEI